MPIPPKAVQQAAKRALEVRASKPPYIEDLIADALDEGGTIEEINERISRIFDSSIKEQIKLVAEAAVHKQIMERVAQDEEIHKIMRKILLP